MDGDLSLEEAQAMSARVVRQAITVSGAALKDFGDPSFVHRCCEGANPILAKFLQRTAVRRNFVLALCEESGLFIVETHVRERKTA